MTRYMFISLILHYIRKLHGKISSHMTIHAFFLFLSVGSRAWLCVHVSVCVSSVSAHFLSHCCCYFQTHILQHTSVTVFSSRYILIRRWVVSCTLKFQSFSAHMIHLHLHLSSSMYSYRDKRTIPLQQQHLSSVYFVRILYGIQCIDFIRAAIRLKLYCCCLLACQPVCIVAPISNWYLFQNFQRTHHFIFSIVRQHLMIAHTTYTLWMCIRCTSVCTMYICAAHTHPLSQCDCVCACVCTLTHFFFIPLQCTPSSAQPEQIFAQLLHVWCMKLRPDFCQWDGMLSLLSCYNSCRSSADLATENTEGKQSERNRKNGLEKGNGKKIT